MTLTACSGWRDSGVNPRNWFGNSRSVPVANTTNTGQPRSPSDRQTGNPLIEDDQAELIVRRNASSAQKAGIFRRRAKIEIYDGSLVDEVTSLIVEPLPTGAIVRVVGLPQREGAFDVRLLPVSEDGPINGVMEYTLNAYQPLETAVGTQRTREVQAGAFLSNHELSEITEIRVRGELNARSTRR
ncbi:MAG: hypothetical protein ACE369_14675 [Roseovarius sp.]